MLISQLADIHKQYKFSEEFFNLYVTNIQHWEKIKKHLLLLTQWIPFNKNRNGYPKLTLYLTQPEMLTPPSAEDLNTIGLRYNIELIDYLIQDNIPYEQRLIKDYTAYTLIDSIRINDTNRNDGAFAKLRRGLRSLIIYGVDLDQYRSAKLNFPKN